MRGTALEWFASYLSNRLQRVSVNGNCSNAFQLKQGVSQGACLGPLLFTLYVSKLPSVVKTRLAWCIFLTFKPDYVLSTNEAISFMELCVLEIRAWMLCDKLKINDDKTEVVIIDRRQELAQGSRVDCLTVGDARVPFVCAGKNLGTWITTNLSRTSSHTQYM